MLTSTHKKALENILESSNKELSPLVQEILNDEPLKQLPRELDTLIYSQEGYPVSKNLLKLENTLKEELEKLKYQKSELFAIEKDAIKLIDEKINKCQEQINKSIFGKKYIMINKESLLKTNKTSENIDLPVFGIFNLKSGRCYIESKLSTKKIPEAQTKRIIRVVEENWGRSTYKVFINVYENYIHSQPYNDYNYLLNKVIETLFIRRKSNDLYSMLDSQTSFGAYYGNFIMRDKKIEVESSLSIPASVKTKINMAKTDFKFENIFMIKLIDVESWIYSHKGDKEEDDAYEVDKMSNKQEFLDPLIVGWDGYNYWLIDAFDMVSAEQALVTNK